MNKVVLLSVLGVFVFTGCHNVGGGIRVDAGYSHGHYNSPPPHAVAHGYRHHRYYYYPDAEFYFDIGRNMYFYLDSYGKWSFSVNLPVRLRHHLHSGFVEIEMEEERPYLRHKYYRNKYKKNKKYKRQYHRSEREHYKKRRDRDYSDHDDEREYKKNKRKKGGFFGDEDDDDKRHKKGRGYDRD